MVDPISFHYISSTHIMCLLSPREYVRKKSKEINLLIGITFSVPLMKFNIRKRARNEQKKSRKLCQSIDEITHLTNLVKMKEMSKHLYFILFPFFFSSESKQHQTFIVRSTRDPSFNSRVGKAISENEIESTLPTEPEQRSGKLYDLAIDSFNNFLASHSLQIKFPSETSQEVSRAIDEGKRKNEK